MQTEEKRIKLFYDITKVSATQCFTLYYISDRSGDGSGEELIPIGSVPDFHSQFRKPYGEGRPWDMEEQLIRQIIRNNPALGIPQDAKYSAQLLIDKKPVEGFVIKNFS